MCRIHINEKYILRCISRGVPLRMGGMCANASFAQVKQLKRGFWHQDTLVDIRFMAETWENACSKLGAEATVDHNAAKCSYLEPTLPPVSQSVPSNTKELVTPKAKDLNIPPKEIPKSISNETGRSLHVHLQQKV